jgi:Spy/CpxP family protein refolding chaperone
MWKKTAPLLIVLSVSMNIAFIGDWAVHMVQTSRVSCETQNDQMCLLYRRLNVTDYQWKQIEPRIAEFRSQVQTIRNEIIRLRTEVIDLIAADKLDLQAIKVKQDQIITCKKQMQQLVIEHLLEEKKVLTDKQQKELFELLRQNSEQGGPRRMMGLLDRDSDAKIPSQNHSDNNTLNKRDQP